MTKILSKEILDRLPEEIKDKINGITSDVLFLNDGNILSELLKLKKNKELLLYQGGVFFDHEDSFHNFHIDVFKDFLKFITNYCVLVIPKAIFERDKFETSFVISDFYLAYKYITRANSGAIILIYEKFNKQETDNSQFLFKYNKILKNDPQLLQREIERISPSIIRDEIELQNLRLQSNTLSVKMVFKLRNWLMKIPGYFYWTKLLYLPLKLVFKVLKGIYLLPRKIAYLLKARKLKRIRTFLEKRDGNLVIVYAGVRYVNNEGQRSVRLTQEFLRNGQKVLYIFWDYSTRDWDLYGEIEKGLFVIPRSQFLEYFNELKKSLICKNSILLIHVPDLEIAKILSDFNAMGFRSIYDILDDWEEFARMGQCFWFDANIEKFILRNTYKRFAVSKGLISKFPLFRINLLPNGFSSTRLKDKKKKKLEVGKRNLGYFGHLTDAWFDWDLILKFAKKEPETYIHVIGYGIPENLKLPQNVKFYGKLQPEELSGYVKNWDACLIPFKDIKLSKSVNPIKVYEYLYFKKPVIVTGIPGMKNFPYVYFSKNNVEDFGNTIEMALKYKIDNAKIYKFLKHNRWKDRAKIILKN